MLRNLIGIFILSLFIACSPQNQPINADYNIVPRVQDIQYSSNGYFTLNKGTKIVYPTGNEALQRTATFLSEYIYKTTNIKIETTDNKTDKNAIILSADFENENKESYNIKISETKIHINGASESGTFYGIQTIRKSLPALETKEINFPIAEITDYPAYKHRGVSLDVVRHFFPAEFVKKYIDVLAILNINILHWHLTDDQGWRIEIKKYPELTEIGAWRDRTIIGRHTGEYDYSRHGGYFTQEEIKEIVKYAEERFITIIPEIDVPGHTLSVLAAYPELGCTGGPYNVSGEWGIFEDVLCAGNEDVFTFLEDIFTEVIPLFPAKYVHIGGDECPKNRWMACLMCQKKINELGLRGSYGHTQEEELQSYFITKVEKMLNEKGKSIIGWDEILEGGVAPNATIMSWRGTEGGVYAANKGHDVIMAPEQYVYLDYYQSPDVDNEPFTFGWLTPLRKTYSFHPMPENLPQDKQKHILGAQANVWAEYMPTEKNVEYMLLPRMCALAEIVWTNPKDRDYDKLVSRLYPLSKHFDKLGYENCKQVYGIQDSVELDTYNNIIKLHLSTFDNSTIYYTMDGKEPTNKSILYNTGQPIVINENATIKAKIFRNGEENKVYSKDFTIHKAVAKPITLKYAPDKRYTFEGANILVNGLSGTKSSYRTGTWLGFLGTDMEADIDLISETDISSVNLNCFVNTRGSLFAPKSLTIFVSQDGKQYKEVYKEKYEETKQHISPKITNLSANFDNPVQGRFIKIAAESVKTLPVWHEKKDDKAYLMIDEIVIL